MDFTDPYYAVQDEVLKNLQATKVKYENWLDTTSENDKARLSNDLKQLVRCIKWDLEDIQETVNIVEQNPARFKLSNHELSNRRQFINQTQDIIKKLMQQVESDSRDNPVISFNVTTARQPSGMDFPSSRIGGDFREPTSRDVFTVRSSPTDPLKQQHELLRNQDERLDHLGSSISNLKGMSQRIGDELSDQVVLLDDFSGEMHHTESRLDAVTKRTARLLHLSTDRRQWCAIGWLSLMLLLIIILLLVL